MPRSSSSSSSSSSNGGHRRGKGGKGKKHGRGHHKGHGHGHGHEEHGGEHHGQQYGGQQYGGQQYGGQQYGGGGGMGYGGNGQFIPADRDQQLRNFIDQIFMKYDKDGRGYLQEGEFAPAIGEICQSMNLPPPSSYQQFIQIAKQVDTNYDGKISKMELFTCLKRMSY